MLIIDAVTRVATKFLCSTTTFTLKYFTSNFCKSHDRRQQNHNKAATKLLTNYQAHGLSKYQNKFTTMIS